MKKGLFGNRKQVTEGANHVKPIQSSIGTKQAVTPTPEGREANDQKRPTSSRVIRSERNDQQEHPMSRTEIRSQLRDADEKFESDKLDEALELYLNAIPKVQKVVDVGDPIIGDINVKISRILQGSAVIEAAIDYMEKAKQIFTAAHKTEKVKEKKLVLGEKIVDAIMGISNLHVNLGEIDKAKIAFEDVVQSCKQHLPDDLVQLTNILNNYANFLSICDDDHEGAMDTLVESLNTTMKIGGGKLNRYSADTLSIMGQLYLRRTATSRDERMKDAKRAEVCFVRALHLYRLASMSNGDQRITETLYNLMNARQSQLGKGTGHLRNVRFEAEPAAEPANQRKYTAYDIYEDDELASKVSDINMTFGDFAMNLFGIPTCGEAESVESWDSQSSEEEDDDYDARFPLKNVEVAKKVLKSSGSDDEIGKQVEDVYSPVTLREGKLENNK